MLSGSAVVFFSFIGFDVVASTAEEVVLHMDWLMSCKDMREKQGSESRIGTSFLLYWNSLQN